TAGAVLLSLAAVSMPSCNRPHAPDTPAVDMGSAAIDFSKHSFSPVIDLPPDYEVYDFTSGYDADRPRSSPFGIGRYDEKRPGMYGSEIFAGQRDIHMGIDIGAPVGT